MIRIFHGARELGTSGLVDDMHRDRKRIFVDLLKWEVPVIDGDYEIDQFDTDAAVYLVAAGPDGEHRGSIRLLPTNGDHILGSIFPGLCDQPVPRSPRIYEISRGCLSPRLRAPERREVRNALTTAAVQYAMMHGIWSFTCIADAGWLRQILSLGWDCRALGASRRIGRAMTGALRIDITTGTLDQLQEAGSYRSLPLALADLPEKVAA
ncbi:acyl-homoserine-lactone synthase [Sphingomonas sp. BIUV-7]|uniref:Acyl-homoserine-lactone synthase n=1 Tax=Sphingomonas natans TaxID=3063330 RepID=A0ABT8YAN9_9SPHN|nr:acyl-homoserine-lactone synthase [Sphingomonas sp. BIUV-7]MDO6415386.1 acyl-homoserine-lactone synthase [Sphingomonas sp. BIUV-7]